MAGIGILTGTFDPVHRGHVSLARAGLHQLGLDEVWLWANPTPAHKSNVLSLTHRIAMIEAATRDETGVRLYDGDLRLLSHEVAVFIQLLDQDPARRVVFLMGREVLAEAWRWPGLVEAADRFELGVVRRHAGAVVPIDGLRVHELRVDDVAPEAASTVIRAQVREGRRPPALSESVNDYIQRHGLYR